MGRKHTEDHVLITCIVVLHCFSFGFCGTLLYIKDTKVNWYDARSLCQSIGMDLVIIESSTEMARVDQCVIDNGGYRRNCWTGGYWDYDIGRLIWVDYSTISYSHLNWDLGEPDCLPSDTCSYVAECVSVTNAGKLRTTLWDTGCNVICEAADGLQNCIVPTTALNTILTNTTSPVTTTNITTTTHMTTPNKTNSTKATNTTATTHTINNTTSPFAIPVTTTNATTTTPLTAPNSTTTTNATRAPFTPMTVPNTAATTNTTSTTTNTTTDSPSTILLTSTLTMSISTMTTTYSPMTTTTPPEDATMPETSTVAETSTMYVTSTMVDTSTTADTSTMHVTSTMVGPSTTAETTTMHETSTMSETSTMTETSTNVPTTTHTATTAVQQPMSTSTDQTNPLLIGIIIGLAAAFTAFTIIVMCCLFWKIFWGRTGVGKVAPEPDGTQDSGDGRRTPNADDQALRISEAAYPRITMEKSRLANQYKMY